MRREQMVHPSESNAACLLKKMLLVLLQGSADCIICNSFFNRRVDWTLNTVGCLAVTTGVLRSSPVWSEQGPHDIVCLGLPWL